jgi:ribosomal protein S18 acetylase RimI-like enzyme
MIALRDLSLPDDEAALLALDASFATDRIYRLAQAGHSFQLTEADVTPLLCKQYSIADQLESLAASDWAQVAVEGTELLGVVAMELQSWNRRAILRHLYVSRSARRRGVGCALVEAAVTEGRKRAARSLWVETQNTNYGAVRFYESMGFECCGLDTSLYDLAETQEGEVALFFSRAIASTTL